MKFDFRCRREPSKRCLWSLVLRKRCAGGEGVGEWVPPDPDGSFICAFMDQSLLPSSLPASSRHRRWSRMRAGNGCELLRLGGVRIRGYLVS